MKIVARFPLALCFASVTLASSVASAHVRWVNPLPRYAPMGTDDMNIKTGPCGRANDSRTTDASRITVYEPGATIMVEFSETIDHPGFYRISFDDDGQDAFVAPTMRSQIQTAPPFTLPVLLDNIADRSGGGTKMYTAMITLPNVECERCTLQLIQVMAPATAMTWDPSPDQDIYYTCADIALRRAGGMGGAGGMPQGGAAGMPPAGAGGLPQGGSGGIPQGGAAGTPSGGAGLGGTGVSGSAPTGGVAGAGVPQGGTAGAPPSGGSPGAGAPSGGAPAAGSPATGEPPAEEGGCTCRTMPARAGGHGFAAALLVAFGLLVRRRGSRSSSA